MAFINPKEYSLELSCNTLPPMILRSSITDRMNVNQLIIGIFILISTIESANGQFDTQAAEIFNNGRTRCYFGGMSIANQGKTIYHTHLYQPDSISALVTKIAISNWRNSGWSNEVFPNFIPGYSESYPVWSPKQKRLYFSSSASVDKTTPTSDLNIWYVELLDDHWTQPSLFHEGNSSADDRLAFIDSKEIFYIISNRKGNYDIFCLSDNLSSVPDISALNSELDEEYISVYPEYGIAFLQRTQAGVSTDLMVSQGGGQRWSSPVSIQYDAKNTSHPYVHRWPMLSVDQGVFYFVAQGIIWQQSVKRLLEFNKVATRPKLPDYQPLAATKRRYGEPEVFGGLTLKTNNGISFTHDMKTVYLSRYTQDRDSSGNQYIKIFRSDKNSSSWSTPQMQAFCKSKVPFEYHPVLSSNGKRLFFNSRAPIPDASVPYHPKNNIWYVDQTANEVWGMPQVISSLVTDAHDDYVSPTKRGDIYFRSDRPGGKGSGDIYMSHFIDGGYQPAENVTELNSVFNENDLCIDPNGRFIIFNRYEEKGQSANIKLFLSIRTTSGWSQPRPVPQLEKPYDFELTPSLSPDGNYFFYEVNANILRVETRSLFTKSEWRDINRQKVKS